MRRRLVRLNANIMMGIHQPPGELFSYQVNLDQRVRADHPLRRVGAHIDCSFVRAEAAAAYGYHGLGRQKKEHPGIFWFSAMLCVLLFLVALGAAIGVLPSHGAVGPPP